MARRSFGIYEMTSRVTYTKTMPSSFFGNYIPDEKTRLIQIVSPMDMQTDKIYFRKTSLSLSLNGGSDKTRRHVFPLSVVL